MAGIVPYSSLAHVQGYIHCGTLLNGNAMVRELIPSLRGDLESQNPIHISLALSAIGMLLLLPEFIRSSSCFFFPLFAVVPLPSLLELILCSPNSFRDFRVEFSLSVFKFYPSG
jgi:hypothetical protein